MFSFAVFDSKKELLLIYWSHCYKFRLFVKYFKLMQFSKTQITSNNLSNRGIFELTPHSIFENSKRSEWSSTNRTFDIISASSFLALRLLILKKFQNNQSSMKQISNQVELILNLSFGWNIETRLEKRPKFSFEKILGFTFLEKYVDCYRLIIMRLKYLC
jgi:hypothetical protein